MKKYKNKFNPLRDHIYHLGTMCPFVMPIYGSARINIENFLKMEKKARLTAYYVQAFSKAVKKHPNVNSGFVRKGFFFRSPNLVRFDHVNAAISVDKKFGELRFPFVWVFKDSDKMTIKEINEQLDYIIRSEVNDIPEFKNFLKFLALPRFIRKIFMSSIVRSEKKLIEKTGTFHLTNISRWGIDNAYIRSSGLIIAIGTTVNNELNLSFSGNHIIADGAQFGETLMDVRKIFDGCDFH